MTALPGNVLRHLVRTQFAPGVTAFAVLATAHAATAQSAWDNPQDFRRLVENVCMNGALIGAKSDRIEMISQLFGFEASTDSGPNAPDLENAEGFTIGWQPDAAPSIFCGLTAPAGFYDEAAVIEIADWLDGEPGSPAPEMGPGTLGPIPRGLLDGRNIQFMVMSDPTDGLVVMGMIQD